LNKAFTIDDPVFLLQAEYIRKEPLNPTAMQICWTEDNRCGPVSTNAANNLLMSYYLAPTLALGGQERAVHALQLVTLWFSIIATVSLAFRFGVDAYGACASGLLVAATPAVLAMASTAMPDVLAMTLGVIGIERLCAWKQDAKLYNAVLSALALGLAPFTRMHLLLLLPVAVVLLWEEGPMWDWRSWWAMRNRLWPLIAAGLIWVGALALTSQRRGVGVGYFWLYPEYTLRNFRSYLFQCVVAMPLGMAWLLLRNRRIPSWLWLTITVGVVAVALHSHRRAWWFTLMAGAGALVVGDVFSQVLRKRDLHLMALALWLLIPLAALPYLHLPPKYLVACAPATALLIVHQSQTVRWRAAALSCIVTAGVVWGSMILYADARFAGMARDAVARLIAPRVAAGDRVWFASQWGFYWYALKAGAKPLGNYQTLTPGDYLARGDLEGYNTLARLPRAVLVDTYKLTGPGGRTMSFVHNAGLYSNSIGELPWAWGTGEFNHYELWRLQ
jgi:hypothetical protein